MARAGRLILVRHAQVDLRADVPAPQWELSAEGRAAALRLAEDPVFDGVRIVASSPGPKAVATAEPIAARLGLTVTVDRDLRESERPEPMPILPDDEHRALVAAYLRGEELDGWEPRVAVRKRMRAAVARLGDDAAVVSHGRALALLLGLTSDQWAAIPLPAVAVADPETFRLCEPFR